MKKMDIYHFVDEVSMLARDFAHFEQDTYPAEDVSMTFVEWLPLFLKFMDEQVEDAGGTAGGLTATSPEFKEFLKTVKPWNGPMPGGWR